MLVADIEAQIREIQSKKKEILNNASEKEQVGLGKTGFYDQDIYDGSNNKYDGYVTSIAANDEIEVQKIWWFWIFIISIKREMRYVCICKILRLHCSYCDKKMNLPIIFIICVFMLLGLWSVCGQTNTHLSW